eukprot:673140-Prymnesium_polylepis.1
MRSARDVAASSPSCRVSAACTSHRPHDAAVDPPVLRRPRPMNAYKSALCERLDGLETVNAEQACRYAPACSREHPRR